MLDTPTTRVAHTAKEHPDYVGRDKEGYVARLARNVRSATAGGHYAAGKTESLAQ